jgi:thiopurine S-methyltransferase
MQPDFWLDRWQENRIGFHQDKPTPLLLKHWPAIGMPVGATVFVPLAGKSVDMVWFASQGYRVLGVELSPLAVKQFFTEHGVVPENRDTPLGTHYYAGNIELVNGDVFALSPQDLADCAAAFDRAALIALPPDMRRRYVHELYSRLPQRCRALLITLEYPEHEKQGPPFSVSEAEVRELFGRDWDIDVLERRDILAQQPAFAEEGVTKLETVVYRLNRK